MKCIQCAHEMVKTEGIYPYKESGLDNVVLVDVPIFKCPSCHEKEVEIPCLEELHQLIAFLIIFSPVPLKRKEARYLRKHLGYTADELARYLGLTRVTVTRWETGKINIGLSHDKALRRLYMSRKASGLMSFPEILRPLSMLIDRLPLPKPGKQLRIRSEDWATCSNS